MGTVNYFSGASWPDAYRSSRDIGLPRLINRIFCRTNEWQSRKPTESLVAGFSTQGVPQGSSVPIGRPGGATAVAQGASQKGERLFRRSSQLSLFSLAERSHSNHYAESLPIRRGVALKCSQKSWLLLLTFGAGNNDDRHYA